MSADDLEAVSNALFKNKHQLAVLRAIALVGDDDWFWARGISDSSGVRENQVGTILRRLEDVGLIVRETDSRGGGQRILFSRADVVLWDLALSLCEWVEGQSVRSL